MASIGTKSYDAVVAQKVAFLGLGVMGLPMAGHLRAPATTSPSITARPPRRRPGLRIRRPPCRHAARSSRGRPDRVRLRRQRRRPAQRGVGPGRRVRRHGAGRGLRRPHHRLGGRGPRAVRAKELGLNFIDAPVSGGQAGAVNGALTIMCGGEQAVFDAIAGGPGLRARRHAGGSPGAGQLAKMVNQICIAGIVQGLSEAVAFGQAADLDMKLVLDVISKGAAQSWQMENRGGTMVDDKLTSASRWTGCARTWAWYWPKRATTAPGCLDRAGGPVLRRCAENGRRPLGYVQPDQAPARLTPRRVCVHELACGPLFIADRTWKNAPWTRQHAS